MEEFDVMDRIQELCLSRGWSYYRLAKASNIPYSTLNSMIHKTNIPSVPTLQKICSGLGITMAQFFSPHSQVPLLTKSQRDCLDAWDALDGRSQELAKAYMQGLMERQRE